MPGGNGFFHSAAWPCPGKAAGSTQHCLPLLHLSSCLLWFLASQVNIACGVCFCFLNLIKNFKNRNIIAVKCCVSFYHTMKWISYMYTYIPLDLSPTHPSAWSSRSSHFFPTFLKHERFFEFYSAIKFSKVSHT